MNEEKKVLVVESDPFLIRLLRAKLKQYGIASLGEEDGKHVFNTAKREKPALIVMEPVLPRKDGFKVLQELREDKETKDIPVCVLTKLDSPEDKERCMELGARECCIKMDTHFGDFVNKVAAYVK